jgi:hypothetical protein
MPYAEHHLQYSMCSTVTKAPVPTWYLSPSSPASLGPGVSSRHSWMDDSPAAAGAEPPLLLLLLAAVSAAAAGVLSRTTRGALMFRICLGWWVGGGMGGGVEGG